MDKSVNQKGKKRNVIRLVVVVDAPFQRTHPPTIKPVMDLHKLLAEQTHTHQAVEERK